MTGAKAVVDFKKQVGAYGSRRELSETEKKLLDTLKMKYAEARSLYIKIARGRMSKGASYLIAQAKWPRLQKQVQKCFDEIAACARRL